MPAVLGRHRHVSDPDLDSFRVSVSHASDAAVLTLDGELDFFAGPGLRDSVDGLADAAPARVVVDLAGVTFLDAGGLGSLIECRHSVGRWGGAVEFRNPSPVVERLARLTWSEDALGLP